MHRESGTQMASIGSFHEDSTQEKVLTPRKYFSAEQLRQLKEKKVIVFNK